MCYSLVTKNISIHFKETISTPSQCVWYLYTSFIGHVHTLKFQEWQHKRVKACTTFPVVFLHRAQERHIPDVFLTHTAQNFC